MKTKNAGIGVIVVFLLTYGFISMCYDISKLF